MIVGGGTNVYALVAEPPGVVTITFTEPIVESAGVMHVIVLPEASTTILEASILSNVTEVEPETKPVPVIVTLCPPNVEPEEGETEVIVNVGI